MTWPKADTLGFAAELQLIDAEILTGDAATVTMTIPEASGRFVKLVCLWSGSVANRIRIQINGITGAVYSYQHARSEDAVETSGRVASNNQWEPALQSTLADDSSITIFELYGARDIIKGYSLSGGWTGGILTTQAVMNLTTGGAITSVLIAVNTGNLRAGSDFFVEGMGDS